MVDAAFIAATVRLALPHAHVEATDLTGGGDHWRAVIVDAGFAGLRPLARQRLVLEPFKPHIASNTVHALDLTCLTPAEAAQAQR
ncbi:MAG TPA: BolA/IbaG family iron-sulfur metabolism protein [Candidatus Thermoplasmatota archaeon]|nr:BolA/IbaG family iron-sulfur metabolism protein [Candidatus Thermoplasmatota archaeon]